MSIDEKLKYISKKLKEHNFQNDIQVRYNDSIKMFEIYVLDNEQEDDFFYGKGNTFEEAMEVAEKACIPEESIHSMPFPIVEEEVAAAIIAADKIGRDYKAKHK